MSNPKREIRRPTRARCAVSCLTSGCSRMPVLVTITAPCSLMIAAYSATRSVAPQACSRIAKPPASPIAYCAWIERQRARPASPSDDGGSGEVTTVAVGGTSDNGGFWPFFVPPEPGGTVILAYFSGFFHPVGRYGVQSTFFYSVLSLMIALISMSCGRTGAPGLDYSFENSVAPPKT